MIVTDIFKKDYFIRRFGQQEIIRGHAVSDFEDIKTKLNVQPLNPDELQSLPEGERSVKRIKAFGHYPLRAADQTTETPGDWLYYKGCWYECKSSVDWDHTLLAHFRSEFVIVPETELEENIKPPKEVAP